MTTAEHLNRIVAKCRELLAIAEKRTPGKWMSDSTAMPSQRLLIRGITFESKFRAANQMTSGDATYIAACAGPAEAGWRTTIATIESVISRGCAGELDMEDELLMDAIIAAWPEELL